jgi:hypothetical protein
MTVVLAAPVKPLGIERRFPRPCGAGSSGKRFVGQKGHIKVNVEKFLRKARKFGKRSIFPNHPHNAAVGTASISLPKGITCSPE